MTAPSLQKPRIQTALAVQASPLMTGAHHGDQKLAEKFLSKGADPNIKSSDHSDALHQTVASGHVGIAGLLLSKGAAVNSEGLHQSYDVAPGRSL
jgi:ankyrin repeat protein